MCVYAYVCIYYDWLLYASVILLSMSDNDFCSFLTSILTTPEQKWSSWHQLPLPVPHGWDISGSYWVITWRVQPLLYRFQMQTFLLLMNNIWWIIWIITISFVSTMNELKAFVWVFWWITLTLSTIVTQFATGKLCYRRGDS